MERDRRTKSKIPCLFGGNGENPNRKTVQPRSQSESFAEKKLFMYEGGQTSSTQAHGTPMKTLLAKEMLNETSAKRRSPSLIAKLMGLDGLPSPQPLHRQHKKLSENSKNTPKRNEESFNHQFDKKSTIEQQHFKDVYEDPEASHVGNQLYSPHFTAKQRSTKLELGYIQERCDEMLRESIAIRTKLERVDSNSDLMLSFRHKAQQDIPYGSLCNHITLLKPPSAIRHGSNGKFLKEEKETVSYHVPVSHQRNEDGHSGYSCHSNHNSRRSSRYQPERKEDVIAISPTRIVVLKPNVARIYSDTESELYKGPPSEFRSSRHKSKEAREIARQITCQMKEGFESGHINIFDPGFIEYASAASESEMMAVSSRSSFHQSPRPRRSQSNMSESAMIKEAKKRMSQRWKTHGYKDTGMVGKSSTLEDMLSVPNNEKRRSKTGYPVGPVGVGDEYDWRDEYLRNASRSRSLSPSSRNRSHKTSNYHEASADDKIMIHKEPVIRSKSNVMKGKFTHKEEPRSKNLRSYGKRCQSSQQCNACSHEFGNILPNETEFQNEHPAVQELLISDIQNPSPKATSVIDVCMLGDADSCAVDEDSLNSQATVCTQLSGPEPESSEGSKEFDQNGQTTVLEVSVTEDVSSGSDCFERVSSQLHELRKQLHLLKMESESAYDSLNDEETEQRSSSFTTPDSENWESAYLTDILQNSGFYDHDPYTFITTFYSMDRPIDPCVFNHLEKKYSRDPTVSTSERRLFYDRVNEAMLVLSKIMLSCPSSQRGIQMTLVETGFADQLQKLLAKQEKEANEEFDDISMDKDMNWYEAVNEVDVVGKDIAEMLVNELVLEIGRGW